MWLALPIFIFALSLLPRGWFFPILEPAVTSLHEVCLSFAPRSEYKEIYEAIVCGAPLHDGPYFENFRALGICYIFVVSGTHLLCVEYWLAKVLRRLKRAQVFLLSALFAYSLMTGFQPPVVRSLFSLLLSQMNQSTRLFWRPPWIALISALLCILLFPEWFGSLSFRLSWAAGIALSVPFQKQPAWCANLKRCALIYVFLIPILLPLGIAHPFSIFTTWLLAPAVGHGMLPLSIAVFLFHPLTASVDALWRVLFRITGPIAEVMIPPLKPSPVESLVQWTYLGVLNFGVMLYATAFKRSQAG